MLSKCANPKCSARMKYMHDGTFHVVPRPAMHKYWSGDEGEFGAPPGKQIECFWLCDVCCRQLTIGKHGELESRNTSAGSFELRIETGPAVQKKPTHATDANFLIADGRAGIFTGETISSSIN